MAKSLIVHQNKENTMLSWALTFLIIGIIAGILGLSGIAGTATNIAWILFVIGLVLALIFFITGRRPPL
jgi:uncharacterized membrane protein YtjA (UPF0391 family)